MNPTPRIALVGDHNPAHVAHQGIPLALTLARGRAFGCEWEWVHSSTLQHPASPLSAFDGIWCVPGSPYAHTEGVIAAIRYARVNRVPFLGTCGGFQHALLEYAEAVWGIARPGHAETDPAAENPLITPLMCALVEKNGEVYFSEGSRLAEIYGALSATEGYHCSFGVNPSVRHRFDSGPLKAVGYDADGDIRAFELAGHPFFVGTLFQPERSSVTGRPHPLIRAFVAALAPP